VLPSNVSVELEPAAADAREARRAERLLREPATTHNYVIQQ